MTRDAAGGQAGRRQCVHARQDDACSHHESSQGILHVLAVACVRGGVDVSITPAATRQPYPPETWNRMLIL